jgi:hypothetical protein
MKKCKCGCKPEIVEHQSYPKTLLELSSESRFIVSCTGSCCFAGTPEYNTLKEAKTAWRRLQDDS